MKKTTIYLIVAGGSAMLLLLTMTLTFFRSGGKANTDFVPGIYACEAVNEFCAIRDTLIIRRMSPSGNEYGITRRSCYQRIILGKKGFWEFQQTQWPASYEPRQHLLTRDGRPDTILYSPSRNQMYKSGFIYQKIE
jgi:hypothetical protein